jgi:DNA-binding NtrC family response regulator
MTPLSLDPVCPTAAVRIVLVDDDRAILEVVANFIQAVFAADVRCFDTPAAALHDFEMHPDECRLVITDFDMPGMNGTELLLAMRRRSPGLQAIVFSGSSEQEIVELGLPPNCSFLPKAGGFPKLIDAVQKLASAA